VVYSIKIADVSTIFQQIFASGINAAGSGVWLLC
jgi:hypothetical protein